MYDYLNCPRGLNLVETFGDALDANNGKTAGFDYLRLILAYEVILVHSFRSSYGSGGSFIWDGFYRPIVAIILPMFFALSGFLVAGSLVRSPRIYDFLVLRALRIVPALAFETVVAALILGPLLTTIVLSEYFRDPEFFAYFLNIVGDVHFHLPGLFLANPDPSFVNIQLWALPVELECYILLTFLAVLGIVNRPKLLVVGLLVGMFYAYFRDHSKGELFFSGANVPQKTLLLSFLAGVVLFRCQHRIPYNWRIFVACVVASLAILYFRTFTYFAVIPIAYITCFIGIANPPKRGFLFNGDYSYGIYLFGYPLQQTYTLLFPDYRIWYLNAIASMAAATGLAMISWVLVENPILVNKRALVSAARFPIRWFFKKEIA